MGRPWVDDQDQTLYPLPFPAIVCEPGVFQPTPGSFLTWKYLFQKGIGEGKSCLDVGCGTGILSVQLARNRARRVEAIDVQQEAVANTHSFREFCESVRGTHRQQVEGRDTIGSLSCLSSS